MSYTEPSKDLCCPHCGYTVRRIRRRFVDRMLSLVYPVYRYRCDSVDCHWEGNLRRGRNAAARLRSST